MTLRDYSGLYRSTQCNHKRPDKGRNWQGGGQSDGVRGTGPQLLALKMEEGGVS